MLTVLMLGTNHVAAFLGAPPAPPASCGRRPAGRLAPHSSAVSHARSPTGGSEQEILPPHYQSVASVAWVQQILDSYEENFGGCLIQGLDRKILSAEEQAREVALADVAVVSHDFLRNANDPIYIYGKRGAHACFLFGAWHRSFTFEGHCWLDESQRSCKAKFTALC